MIDEELRKSLDKYGEEEEISFLRFDNPSFDKSIVGISNTGVLVYDYDLMIKEFAWENKCSEEEAREFIDYNTLRALPYAGEGKPIIIMTKADEIKEAY